jgi:hypothetical protein
MGAFLSIGHTSRRVTLVGSTSFLGHVEREEGEEMMVFSARTLCLLYCLAHSHISNLCVSQLSHAARYYVEWLPSSQCIHDISHYTSIKLATFWTFASQGSSGIPNFGHVSVINCSVPFIRDNVWIRSITLWTLILFLPFIPGPRGDRSRRYPERAD